MKESVKQNLRRLAICTAVVLMALCVVAMLLYFFPQWEQIKSSDLSQSVPVMAPSDQIEPSTESATEPSTEPATEPPEPSVVRIKAAGDNLVHDSIYKQAAARAAEKGSEAAYDFDYAYQHVAWLMRNADLTMINQETIVSPIHEPSGYPRFNSPPELIDCMWNTLGIDLYNLANNHTLDQGEAGMLASLDFWENSYPDAITTGLYRNAEDYARIRTTEIDGITFAFVGLTDWTNMLSLPEESEVVWPLGKDEQMVFDRIKEAKSIADFVIVNVHWGNEYTHVPIDRQRYMAQQMADHGADLIVGHHPHVIQPIETFTASDGREVPVAFSLGNFISAQAYGPRMLGGVLDFTVVKETPDAPATVQELKFIPIVTHYDRGYKNIRVYPLSEYTEKLANAHGVRGNSSNFSLTYLNETVAQIIDEKYLVKNP